MLKLPTLGALNAHGVRFVVVLALMITGCGHTNPQTIEKATKFQAEGARAYAQGDLDRAAGLFALALEYEPKMAEARNGLGLVALARGDKATAESQFRAALAINEELAEAHHNLGLLQLERNQLDEAMTRFRQALAIDPGFGPARLAVGETLMLLGRPDEARWEILKLTEVEPQNAKAQAAYARVLIMLGRVAAAEAAAQKALGLDPNLPAAHRARGEILKSRRDFPAAIEEYRAILKVEPMSIDDRVKLVECLTGANQQAEIDVELTSLEKSAPAMPQVAFLRAYVSLNRGQLGQAIESARRAIRLRRRYPEARMVLAEALLQAGQNEEGREELRRFADEAPPQLEMEKRRALEFLQR